MINYNADRCGLFWKCLPIQTLAFESEQHAPGHKASKDRLTVMCSKTASQLKLVIVGKS